MKIGIIGLGLIGGSIAKALRERTGHELIGFDTDEETMQAALEDGVVAEGSVLDCDVLYICLHPRAAVRYVHTGSFREGMIVTDVSGVKALMHKEIGGMLTKHGVRYAGSHPMAGREVGGYASSRADLFDGASYIITTDSRTDPEAVRILRELADAMGFGLIVTSTPAEHDRIIAYTSQMAHIVSNAYVKNEAALEERGFSAGSFQDLTRVAQLDPDMWTELFLANREELVRNLDEFSGHLQRMRDALASDDEETLHALLKDGSDRRKAILAMEKENLH